MKRNVNLVPWTDLLSYATTIGYDWNQAHKILVDDEVPPMYEVKVRDYTLEDMGDGTKGKDAYGWSEDSIKIVKGFMETEKITEMSVVDE